MRNSTTNTLNSNAPWLSEVTTPYCSDVEIRLPSHFSCSDDLYSILFHDRSHVVFATNSGTQLIINLYNLDRMTWEKEVITIDKNSDRYFTFSGPESSLYFISISPETFIIRFDEIQLTAAIFPIFHASSNGIFLNANCMYFIQNQAIQCLDYIEFLEEDQKSNEEIHILKSIELDQSFENTKIFCTIQFGKYNIIYSDNQDHHILVYDTCTDKLCCDQADDAKNSMYKRKPNLLYGLMNEALFLVSPKKKDLIYLFHDFENTQNALIHFSKIIEYSSYLNENNLSLKIMPVSIRNIAPIVSMFNYPDEGSFFLSLDKRISIQYCLERGCFHFPPHKFVSNGGDKKKIIKTKNDSINLNGVLMFLAISPVKTVPQPTVAFHEKPSYGITVTVPPIQHYRFIKSMELLVFHQNTINTFIIRPKPPNITSKVEVRCEPETKYTIILRVSNGCGNQSSEPIEHQTPEVELPPQVKEFVVKRLKEDVYLFSWKPPGIEYKVKYYILEGIKLENHSADISMSSNPFDDAMDNQLPTEMLLDLPLESSDMLFNCHPTSTAIFANDPLMTHDLFLEPTEIGLNEPLTSIEMDSNKPLIDLISNEPLISNQINLNKSSIDSISNELVKSNEIDSNQSSSNYNSKVSLVSPELNSNEQLSSNENDLNQQSQSTNVNLNESIISNKIKENHPETSTEINEIDSLESILLLPNHESNFDLNDKVSLNPDIASPNHLFENQSNSNSDLIYPLDQTELNYNQDLELYNIKTFETIIELPSENDSGLLHGVKLKMEPNYTDFRIKAVNEKGFGEPSNIIHSNNCSLISKNGKCQIPPLAKKYLNDFYVITNNPTLDARMSISKKFNIPISRINSWFASKRYRDKLKSSADNSPKH